MATTAATCYRCRPWEISVTHLNNFWIFQLWGQISRKSVRGSFSKFVALSTKSTMKNRNMRWKPELEVVFGTIIGKTHFLGFSRAKISVAMGVTRPIFGAVSYVWGLNTLTKFQGRSSRASYICHVSFSAFLAFAPMFGAVAWPQLDACVQSFSGVRYYAIQPTNVESFAFLTRLVF